MIGMLGIVQVQAQMSPKEILQKAGEACLKVQNIRYKIVSKKRNGIIEEAEVVQEKANVPALVLAQKIRIKIQGKVSFPDKAKNRRFAISYDGQKIYRKVASKKQLIEMTNPTIKQAMKVLGFGYLMIPVFQFGQKNPFQNVIPRVKKFEMLTDKLIYGVNCYQLKLHQDINGRSSQITWYVGKRDFLPRGLKIPGIKSQKELKILALNTNLPKGTFKISLPSGYVKKNITAKDVGLLTKGKAAPNWTLKTPEGKPVSLSNFKGKVVLLDFWGTWCAPCLRAMPTIQALYDQYKAQGLEVVGIAVKDRPGAPEKYMKKKGYTYRLALNGIKVAREYKVAMFPTVYIIDRNGNVNFAKAGASKNLKEVLRKAIEKVIR